MPSEAITYIGTSGWSYPRGEGTWQGYFYPSGKINELEYYSQFFNTVEINSSFYRPPAPGFVANWARRVPPGFLFSVKLWQKFTHPAMYREATGEAAVISLADVDRFKSSLEPLAKSGKLGALLAQFPPSFKNDGRGRQVLGAVANAFGEYPLAVELRHRSWSDDAGTARLLRECRAAWVQIDEPKFATSVAEEVPLTADLAYFRFHGRNARDWWTGDSETRYRYLYSPEEIVELADRVRAAGEKVKMLFAFFNNHWQAYAPRNANDLKKSLQLSFRDLPVPFDVAEDGKMKSKSGGAV
ncbi:MAG TPA: DUF72 domain-containing protein [Dehalococcoidales bacterium]|nr:MAG: hypothetical protein A2Z05_02530 [Chloroflexi bacterium RBG_16_60_22]HJX13699.1 DUF72 domain-containing protein [Dehalococcoidales bacterium]